MEAYHTHVPVLTAELDRLPDDARVLEFGVGDGSSKVMRDFALKNPDARIEGYDTDARWATNMRQKYVAPNYKIIHYDRWPDFLESDRLPHYDLIFVDQSPWDERIKTINAMKDATDVIVLHDYDYFNIGKWSNRYSVGHDSFFCMYLDEFALEAHTELMPPTLVMRKIKSTS